MDDNTYWATIWKLVAISFAALVMTIGGCTVHQQTKVTELVRAGADPIKARCGVVGVTGSSDAAICGVAAAK